MNNFGGMRPRSQSAPDFTVGQKQADTLTRAAAQKLGRPEQEIKQAIEGGGLSGLLQSLSPADAKRLEEVLSDRQKLDKLLNSKKAKMLLSQLLK